MTVVLGCSRCPVIGCKRQRHVSPSGIRYGACLAHSTALLGRAFSRQDDAQQGAGPVAATPRRANATGPLLVGVLPITAVVNG